MYPEIPKHAGPTDKSGKIQFGPEKHWVSTGQNVRYTGQTVRYKILGLLYKRALFDLQFVHNLFWLKLKWNARSKILLYHLSFLHALMKFKDIVKIKVAISETL
jgi:hypothetical protein